MHPPFLFCLAKRETGRARSKEKSAWRAPVQWPSARRGSADRCLRRFGLAFGHAILFCDSCNCCPVADGAEGVGVVIALRCFSFRCRWPVVDEGFSNGLLLHRLLRPPGQRVAKRNARKEERVKCVLAPRPKMHRAAGINHQVCPAPRRARSPVLANPQAPSHADPRTATLHARAKLLPKRLFLLHRARRVLFLGKTKKRMGGASPVETAPWREPDSPSNGTHPIQPTTDKGSKL